VCDYVVCPELLAQFVGRAADTVDGWFAGGEWYCVDAPEGEPDYAGVLSWGGARWWRIRRRLADEDEFWAWVPELEDLC
jgi:hypothetical protein